MGPYREMSVHVLILLDPLSTDKHQQLSHIVYVHILFFFSNAMNHCTLGRGVAWFRTQIEVVLAHLVRRVQPRGGTIRIALPSDERVHGRTVQTHQTSHGGGAGETQQRSDKRNPFLLVQTCRGLGNSGWVLF